MPKDYTRTKDEYVQLYEHLHKTHGDKLRVPVYKLHQKPGFDYRIVSAPLSTAMSHLLFQRIPRTHDSPDGVQRAFKDAKVNEIAEIAGDDKTNYSAPGAMVTSLMVTERPGVTIEWTDERNGFIIFDLPSIKQHLDEQPDDESMDETKFMVGYMIDAHHRTEGHYQAGLLDFEMNTTIYIDLPRDKMAQVFALVNEKQEKPSPTHTLAMRQLAGMLKPSERSAYELAEEMNSDENSILYQRIKMFDGRTPKGQPATYVNLKPFTDLLQDKVLKHIASGEQVEVVENYFRAWQAVFPDAWADEKTHVLVKSMGFSIMLRLFPTIYTLAKLTFRANSPDHEQFAQVIGLLRDLEITADESDLPGVPLPLNLDWSSGTFGALSSGKGIGALSSVLEQHLSNNALQLAKVA